MPINDYKSPFNQYFLLATLKPFDQYFLPVTSEQVFGTVNKANSRFATEAEQHPTRDSCQLQPPPQTQAAPPA